MLNGLAGIVFLLDAYINFSIDIKFLGFGILLFLTEKSHFNNINIMCLCYIFLILQQTQISLKGQAQQHTPLILALRKQRQADLCECQVSLVYRVKPCLKTTKLHNYNAQFLPMVSIPSDAYKSFSLYFHCISCLNYKLHTETKNSQ